MKNSTTRLLVVLVCILAPAAFASASDLTNGENRVHNTQAGGSGIPSRAPDLDVLPGFRNPPLGYGEVPFWWWTGDWSKIGILHNYSGGVRNHAQVTLNSDQTKGKVVLDLGNVAGTAEIRVNGQSAGVRDAPPWRQEVTGLLKEGTNTIEVLVYNTLSNHYQTIPSRYRGEPLSGLLGPVRLLSRDWPAP